MLSHYNVIRAASGDLNDGRKSRENSPPSGLADLRSGGSSGSNVRNQIAAGATASSPWLPLLTERPLQD
ncbi:MAG: hypothetical protein ABSA16_07240 [Thermoguttaceae bacterium]